MERLLTCIFTVLCLVSGSIGKKGFGPGQQEWGFIQVFPDVHMFWWLYYTTANVTSYYDKPLIIWLQGGPGVSSTAYGNFEELGPLDTDLNPRNYTWVKDYNVLFIDNPVGTGFSYVENDMAYAPTNVQIAHDLLECIRGFYAKLPEFKPVPAYITTQSYGGKMGAEFALVWNKAQKAGTIESNLRGIMLGSPWISPVDSVLAWGPFLLSTGVVDTGIFKKIDAVAKMAKDHIETGQWLNATDSTVRTIYVIIEETSSVDFFNILTKKDYSYHLLPNNRRFFDLDTLYRYFMQRETRNQLLDKLMNGPVKEALGLNVSHGELHQFVYSFLYEDIMKPVTNIVEQLLNETDLHVFVYNGQLDLLVNTQGTLRWVEKLKWKGAYDWRTFACRKPLFSENIVEGYFKIHDNFGMYWVNRAGHMVPRDNPAAMELILQDFVSNANQKQNKQQSSSIDINIKTNKKCYYT